MTQNAEPWDIATWCTQWIAVESQYLNVWIHVLYCVYIPPPLPLTLEYLAGGKARNLWDIFRAREISSPLRVFRASKRDGGGCSGCQTYRSKSKPRMTSTNSCLWPLRIPRNGILLLPWNFWRAASRAVKYHGSAPPQKISQAKLGERKTYENACFSRFARTLPHQQVPVDA
jgi:hypothetical protein